MLYFPPVVGPTKFLITNRNIGSPSTINITITYPSNSDAPTDEFLRNRIGKTQEIWPLLKCDIIDQRTTTPKIHCRSNPWTSTQILSEHTYTRKSDQSEDQILNEIYEKALRSFQLDIDYSDKPLWGIKIYRSDTSEADGQTYICLLIDHAIIDGRGAVKLASALICDEEEFSKLPRETIEFYQTRPKQYPIRPPIWFLIKTIFSLAILPNLPSWLSSWFGYKTIWPDELRKKPIEAEKWKSSIFSLDRETMQSLKQIGKQNGINTLNPLLYAIFCVAHWITFKSPLNVNSFTVKDLRNKTDPYCLFGRACVITHQHSYNDKTSIWELAKEYSKVCLDENRIQDGINLLRMIDLDKNEMLDTGPTIISSSSLSSDLKSPKHEEFPKGDKTPKTKLEFKATEKINSLKTDNLISGIWSNIGYFRLPDKKCNDMIFGVSGNQTSTPYNICLIGHENGIRIQNTWLEDVVMDEKEVKSIEITMKLVIDRLLDGNKDNTFESLGGSL
ncbi:uncharacterized protein L201_006225 [Kwoniella dendrophila CBS 6074]|uniref:Alcohol acetyltransferase n=1 Tax=Kwoniella dendrophila CBS 6074 TaxID=1295534 RepID=A0AAX4K165_9TREE